MIYTVKNNQSILDIALQKFGNLEYLFEILSDNNLDINQQLSSGMELSINPVGKGDETIKKYFSTKKITTVNGQVDPNIGLGFGDYGVDYANDYLL